jgi:hypothetical protein
LNYDRLIAALKFKQQRNSTYFIVKSDFTIQDQNIKIYKGGMLLFSDIPAENDQHLFMHIIYKVKPLSSDISITADDEGLIKMKYIDLASLIIAEKIEARYTDVNNIDREIYDIIS